ncbi:WecB/TagA/CpsF family glycosyltransferase [Pseudorhizobium halotolerans]|nr:WecB/TagA/CpsF family glycosyltransferase [Pseudorhizobium halotolerans]
MAAIDTALSLKERLVARRCFFLGAPFDLMSRSTVLRLLEDNPPERSFRYVVTPNVDYVVRMSRDAELRRYVAGAWLSLCDSRPIRTLARLMSIRLPLVTGSDLTADLFRSVVSAGDAVTIVAANEEVVVRMRSAYPQLTFHAIVPPYGVRSNPEALQACVEFVAQARSRFVFLAIGSPQSDMIAHQLSCHPHATGLGLNVGAGLEFLVGTKRRAPIWMQRSGLEWAHRLLRDPKRLWRRYVFSVIPLAKLFSHELLGRSARHG